MPYASEQRIYFEYPAIVKPGLCGGNRLSGKARPGPISNAMTSADTPAVVWTTIPPGEIDRAAGGEPTLAPYQCATGT